MQLVQVLHACTVTAAPRRAPTWAGAGANHAALSHRTAARGGRWLSTNRAPSRPTECDPLLSAALLCSPTLGRHGPAPSHALFSHWNLAEKHVLGVERWTPNVCAEWRAWSLSQPKIMCLYFDSPVAVVTLSCEPVAMRNRLCAPAAIIQFCVIRSRSILFVNVLAFFFFSATE